MKNEIRRLPEPIYDLIGVGFGPANLALAIALEEDGEGQSSLFLEAKDSSVWHPGMLLEESQIQISVLKDLATLRNPRSQYTFLNYLKEKGRLFEFLNLRDLFPTRYEFNDYLAWVAAAQASRVRYGREVMAIEPIGSGSKVDFLRVVSRRVDSDEIEESIAKNVVLATGGVPALPEGLARPPRGGRTIHTHEFMQRMQRDFPDRSARHRFVVVGAGQSGGELFSYLLDHYPNSDVVAAIRRFAYKPCDDSDFTNEIFFPDRVDWLYNMAPEKRQRVLAEAAEVNYAVVDRPLIQKIYRRLYQERVEGKNRARLQPFADLVALEERDHAIIARFVDLLTDEPSEIEADAVILATGYRWPSDHPLLAGIAPYLVANEEGGEGFQIERDYRVKATSGFAPGIYLQGFSERRHGPSETVLSLLAVRAGDIVQSLTKASASRETTSETVVVAAAS
jgi:L-ornithine N5-monooxygenase